ncbi:acrosomal protein SP-10-like [Mesocricetus auratus]|uniref:Acrosomal protein SP-10-like n=1 Tax=Mesocricetus auratus TaxID=10036 RepID=A0ABM2WCT5_MESAU|nr:acrosomal protein SP-10-like [Mesocricetus auratus]
MENLLKLCLFLLCLETTLSVQCVLCPTYKNGECVDGNQTCTTKPGETCMIRRIWSSYESYQLLSAELTCTDVCNFDETFYKGLTTHTYCCDSEDFCNDINLPIVMA